MDIIELDICETMQIILADSVRNKRIFVPEVTTHLDNCEKCKACVLKLAGVAVPNMLFPFTSKKRGKAK